MTERTHNEEVSYFIAFCSEIYKNAHSLRGEEVSEIFSKHEILTYLADNYDVLHTQSPAWILEEIDELIKNASK